MNKSIFLLVILALAACSNPEPRKPIVRKSGTFMKESIERNKQLNKFEEDLLQLKMQKDSVHNYIASDQGFWYYYEQKDSIDQSFPQKGDEVLFSYEVKRINDSIVYSKESLGDQLYVVDKQELIAGLQDGIKLMKPGEIVTFLFPSHKAYGYAGTENINPNEPLIYTVHLKEIKNKIE